MNNKSKLYADDLPYFKTSTSAPDGWIDKAKAEIVKAGGKVTGEAFASDGDTATFMLLFFMEGDHYKVVFNVLEPRNAKDLLAAKRQAATMLYHDIKARCLLVRVFGARRRFADFLMLPDSTSTLGDVIQGDMLEIPKLLALGKTLELVSGEIVT